MELILDKNPTEPGLYVAYINGKFPNTAEKKLLLYANGVWIYPGSPEKYREQVYGWIGPLPALFLQDN